MNRTMSLAALLTSLLLTACPSGGADDPLPGDGDAGDKSGTPCGNTTCPLGQYCWNGLCQVGCNTNQECAADQYCDTTWHECANKVVTTCPETPCEAGKVCMQGFCSEKDDSTQCTIGAAMTGNDGCSSNALCLDAASVDYVHTPKCFEFAPCGENDSCPTGAFGAVCNVNLIPNKGRICLPTLCKTAANCPSAWHCVRATSTAVVGTCSGGGFGQPCTTNSECADGLSCFGAMPGALGSCM